MADRIDLLVREFVEARLAEHAHDEQFKIGLASLFRSELSAAIIVIEHSQHANDYDDLWKDGFNAGLDAALTILRRAILGRDDGPAKSA